MEYMPEYYSLNLEKTSAVNKPIVNAKKAKLPKTKPFTMFYILKDENNMNESINQIFINTKLRNIGGESEVSAKKSRIRNDLSLLLKNKPDNFVLFNVTQSIK